MIETHTEIIVSPEDDIEMRRVNITNHGNAPVRMEITSYAEVVLALPAEEAAHPAFSNLFVQTEIVSHRTSNTLYTAAAVQSRETSMDASPDESEWRRGGANLLRDRPQ